MRNFLEWLAQLAVLVACLAIGLAGVGALGKLAWICIKFGWESFK